MSRATIICLVGVVLWTLGCGRGDAPSASAVPTDETAVSALEPEATATDSATDAPAEPPAASEPPDPERSAADAAFKQLVRAYRDGDPPAWEDADERLTGLGKSALPTLAEALRTAESRSTRELAAIYLVRLGPDAADAIDVLLASLDDDSPIVRANAASALSLVTGPFESSARSRRIVQTLTDLLGDPDVSRIAVIALGNFAAQAAPAVPRLTDILEDGDPDLRTAAAATLGRIGPSAEAAVPALEKLAEHDHEATRAAAAEALRHIQDEAQD